MTKESSFGSSRGVLTCLLTLSFQAILIATFADYFSFRQFSATSCSFWEKKTKIVIFCTIFQEKQVNFLQSRLTTLQKNDKETFFLDFSGSLGLAHNSQLPNDAYLALFCTTLVLGIFRLLLVIQIQSLYIALYFKKNKPIHCVSKSSSSLHCSKSVQLNGLQYFNNSEKQYA